MLDRKAARQTVVRALASFTRAPVALPVRVDAPNVTVASLAPAQRRASQVIAAPVVVTAGPTRLRIPRWRLAKILQLPTTANTPISLTGPAADAYFRRLENAVNRAPKDADFAVNANGSVRVVPARTGVALDVPRSAARILAAAERPTGRVAPLAIISAQPQLTTAKAQALGITGTVGTYSTVYGGDPNRIHNVQLVAHLVDGKLIAPGSTFSFNGATGERSAAKGFLEAPVIINGELQTGLGGGVCQVSTTVFNAAYEAGLPITARTNHALYISHYPLGRDATVNYPDTDLKFVNDTGHWLLRPHVRRHVLADRRPVRRATAPPGRDDGRAVARRLRRRRSRRRSTRRSSRARRSSTSRACPRRRPPSSGRSTHRAASCSRIRPGTRATARSRA